MASQSYLAESYLVLAVHILLLPEDGLFFLPCSPLSSGNVAWPRGQPVSSVGKLWGAWEGENKQWLSGFSRQA